METSTIVWGGGNWDGGCGGGEYERFGWGYGNGKGTTDVMETDLLIFDSNLIYFYDCSLSEAEYVFYFDMKSRLNLSKCVWPLKDLNAK